ncbi:MAG: TetR family transcriptional regulator [Micavibrio sp.]|nr:TetR family transcriptional regulator [Micavibrio sp.]
MQSVKRGRPHQDSERTLTQDSILDQAVALIDEVGLEKFSVRALAQRLGVFPGAIYWHLPTRNMVLAGSVNHCLKDVEPLADPSDWKAWLTELLHEYRAIVRRHPNIAPLIVTQLISNAGANFKLVDTILDVLTRAGFQGEKLYHAYDIVITAKVGFVTMEHAALPAEEAESWTEVMKTTIAGLDETGYPNIYKHRAGLANRHFILRWENGVTNPLDASFEAHVYATIEGLRMLLTR